MSIELPPLPKGSSASDWGGRDTGPCLYRDDEVLAYARTAVESAVATAVASLQAENAALRAQVDSLTKDAERYRWLREKMAYRILCDFPAEHTTLPYGRENWPDGVDAAIDAARGAA